MEQTTYRAKYKCSCCGSLSYSFHTMTMRTDTAQPMGIPFSAFVPCKRCWEEHREKLGMQYLIYAEKVNTEDTQ